MDPIVVHSSDDLPTIYFTIYDEDNACLVDLSAVTTIATAKFRAKGTSTVLQTVVCTRLWGGATGMCSMEWPATALDVDYGRYEIEVSVDFNDAIQTANTYHWLNDEHDTDDTLPVRVKEDF